MAVETSSHIPEIAVTPGSTRRWAAGCRGGLWLPACAAGWMRPLKTERTKEKDDYESASGHFMSETSRRMPHRLCTCRSELKGSSTEIEICV